MNNAISLTMAEPAITARDNGDEADAVYTRCSNQREPTAYGHRPCAGELGGAHRICANPSGRSTGRLDPRAHEVTIIGLG